MADAEMSFLGSELRRLVDEFLVAGLLSVAKQGRRRLLDPEDVRGAEMEKMRWAKAH